MSESLYTTQVPDGGNGDLADLTKGTTATRIMFAAAGTVSAIRFYAPATVAGATFTGELWRCTNDTTGTLLGSKAVSVGITGGAWNNITLDTPISVATGTVYATAVHNTAGRYVARVGTFTSADLVNGNIRGLQSGTNPNPPNIGSISNGVFFDNVDAGTFPNKNFGQPSYLIDVVFDATVGTTQNVSGDRTETISLPGALGISRPASGSADITVALSGALSVSGGAPVQSTSGQGWWSWKNIMNEARQQHEWLTTRPPIACPNDGEPLITAPDGRLFCPYDGWPNV